MVTSTGVLLIVIGGTVEASVTLNVWSPSRAVSSMIDTITHAMSSFMCGMHAPVVSVVIAELLQHLVGIVIRIPLLIRLHPLRHTSRCCQWLLQPLLLCVVRWRHANLMRLGAHESKHIYRAAVCDSNIRVPVTLVKHPSIQHSCDLDGYGLISGEPSCRNNWHFKKSLSPIPWCKVDTRVVEGGKCWYECCMGLCIAWSDEHLFPYNWHLWGKNAD